MTESEFTKPHQWNTWNAPFPRAEFQAGWLDAGQKFNPEDHSGLPFNLRFGPPNKADPRQFADLPEHALWATWIQAKVLMANGWDSRENRGRHAICRDCHFDTLGCGCTTVQLGRKQPPIVIHNKRQCVKVDRWYFDTNSIGLFDDGVWYYRGLSPKCKKAPTTQDCAKAWFASEDAEVLCTMLGLDLSYVKKLAGVA